MNYQEEIELLIDSQGLIGHSDSLSDLRKSYWTNGNSLLDSYTDLIIRKKLGILTESDTNILKIATWNCWIDYPNKMFDKNPRNPNGEERKDEITHDDILGVSCGSSFCDLPFAKIIKEYGEKNTYFGTWLLSNTKRFYWEAFVKPWHLYIYQINAGERIIPLKLFVIKKYLGTPNINEPSDTKLKWVICQAIQGKYKYLDDHIEYWMRKLNEQGGIKEVFKRYYGDWHPFTKYGEFID